MTTLGLEKKHGILLCFTMLFRLLLLNKLELDDRDLGEISWPSLKWDSELCLERWRKITYVCDVILRPPPGFSVPRTSRKYLFNVRMLCISFIKAIMKIHVYVCSSLYEFIRIQQQKRRR